MKILVDLDDTLVNMMEKAVYYYNKRPERVFSKLEFDGLNEWNLPDRPVFESIWGQPGFFADLPWMDPDARPVLQALKRRGHKIVVCSAVPTWESCRDKYSWCHTNLRIPGIIDSMDDVILTRGKHHINGDCMIDDKPSNLEGRKYPILFRRPWNQNVMRFRRARSWDEVWTRVKEIEITQEFDELHEGIKHSDSFHLGGCV